MTDYELNGPWLSEPSTRRGPLFNKGVRVFLMLACVVAIIGALAGMM